MYNPLPYLPEKFQQIVLWFKTRKAPSKLIFILLGFLATLWFLVRVIPKPSRAHYPCMQATAPFMSGFVIYLLSLGGSVTSFKQFRYFAGRSKFLMGALFLAGSLLFFFFTTLQMPSLSHAGVRATGVNYFTPNAPIGVAKGIFPGRVVWMWNPAATNENCTNTSNNNGVIDDGDDAWFMAKNNNIGVIDSMITKSLLPLTGASTIAGAWDSLFRFYNRNHGFGNSGYASNQKVFIKVNATSAYGGIAGGKFYADLSRTDNLSVNDFVSETNPYVVLAVLRQLINIASVPQEMIYVGDPARNIYKEFYDLWHNEFPLVHVLGNNLIHTEINIVALGRTPVAVTATDRVFFSDHGTVMPDAVTDKLFTLYDSIAYLINIPALKAHSIGGITLAAKNHFGSFTREWAMHLHKGLMDGVDNPVRLGYGLYRVQTDIMMHKLLGGKNLLILVDGLYPGEDALGVPQKWTSPPFNNSWCSSLFMSLDPVAIESVCHDFLRTEYNGPTLAESRPNWYGVDDYLHQAADSSLWPKNIIYDPDNDGLLIASLGVHEHWNDSLHKDYTRNLGTGFGIELYKAHEPHTGIAGNPTPLKLSVYPNPVVTLLHVVNPGIRRAEFSLINQRGEIVQTGYLLPGPSSQIDLSQYNCGVYILQLRDCGQEQEIKIIKQ